MQTQTNQVNPSEQASKAAGQAMSRMREVLDNGADLVDKTPIATITDKTLKLNRITHDSTARFVRLQSDFFDGTVDATAKRLRTAAHARDMRDLIKGQMEMFPATRERIVDDIRKTIELFGDTRDDLTALFRETLEDLRGEKTMAETIDDVAEEASEQVAKATETVRKTTRKAKTKATAK